MPTLYMTLWSSIIIVSVGAWRLRSWGKIFIVALVTALVLLISQSLFIQLALAAGVDPGVALSEPAAFLNKGPLGWLALLIMPCGWLGPIIGLNLVRGHMEQNRLYEE